MDKKLLKEAQNRVDYDEANNPAVKIVLGHVKDFVKRERVMCYGGTAINNLLPPAERFYDPHYDVPDYDFYSESPQEHAMKLADEFFKMGFKSVEVKPGAHLMTYKVFVDFMGVADITYLHPPIFKKLWEENVYVGGIHYVTPNFLRMSMYLELSRPRGDIERWTKVYDRLTLLNKHYPVGCKPPKGSPPPPESMTAAEREAIEDVLENTNIIVLGVRAIDIHSRVHSNVWNLPIDLIAEPSKTESVVDRIAAIFKGKAKVVSTPAYADLLPRHFDINDKESGVLLCRVFDSFACHSYHSLPRSRLLVASIPTLLQFFFGFVYADEHYLESYDTGRLVCIAQRLVDLANSEGNRRFKLLTPIDCVGRQESLRDIKRHTSDLKEKTSKNSLGFLKFFFTYKPGSMTGTQKKKLRKNLRRTMRSSRYASEDIADLVSDKTE
uniref:Poly(A) polymerase catalytic subunit domain-containing protein n=1 Tax=viral metagenome TaxID=1070528 RepID=A0A6C0HLT1_9ZZZZ